MLVPNLHNDISWIKKAQLQKATALMCMRVCENSEQAVLDERNQIFVLGIIKNAYPLIKLYIFFSTNIIINENRLLGDGKNKTMNVNCKNTLINIIMACNLENDGVGAFFWKIIENKIEHE